MSLVFFTVMFAYGIFAAMTVHFLHNITDALSGYLLIKHRINRADVIDPEVLKVLMG